MGRFQVFETPLALARYKQASTDLLAMLDTCGSRTRAPAASPSRCWTACSRGRGSCSRAAADDRQALQALGDAGLVADLAAQGDALGQ